MISIKVKTMNKVNSSEFNLVVAYDNKINAGTIVVDQSNKKWKVIFKDWQPFYGAEMILRVEEYKNEQKCS